MVSSYAERNLRRAAAVHIHLEQLPLAPDRDVSIVGKPAEVREIVGLRLERSLQVAIEPVVDGALLVRSDVENEEHRLILHPTHERKLPTAGGDLWRQRAAPPARPLLARA